MRNQVFKRSLFLSKENDQFSADIRNEKSTEEVFFRGKMKILWTIDY